MSRNSAFRTTCTITRNPAVGETDITTIVTNLPCMPVFPISLSFNNAGQQWLHGTQFDGLGTITEWNENIQQEDIFTCQGQVYTITKLAAWPLQTGKVLSLTLEQRT